MASIFNFQIPPVRLPIIGILGRSSALPPEKNVEQELLNTWAIFYEDDSTSVFDYDSLVDMGYDHAQKVSNFPVEEGGFISYNKVNEPRTCKLKLTVHGGVRVKALLRAAETELQSVNVYRIITPERTYHNMTLHKVGYPRNVKNRDMVEISMDFLEIVFVTSMTAQGQVVTATKVAKAKPPIPLVNCHTPPASPKSVAHRATDWMGGDEARALIGTAGLKH